MPVQEDDVLRVTAKMSLENKDVQNVYHYQLTNDGPFTNAEVFNALQADVSFAYAELRDEISNLFSFDTIEVWNVTQDAPIDEDLWQGFFVGLSNSSRLPRQVCGMVLFNTATARSQGRKFLGGVVEDASNAEGDPDAAMQLAMLSYSAVLLNGATVGGGLLVPGNYRALPERFAAWTSAIVLDTWKTQRRRYITAGS